MLLNQQTIQKAKINFANREIKGDLYDYFTIAMNSEPNAATDMNAAILNLLSTIAPSETNPHILYELVFPYAATLKTSFKQLNKVYGIDNGKANHDLPDTVSHYSVPADTLIFIYNGHTEIEGTVYDKDMKQLGQANIIISYTQGIIQAVNIKKDNIIYEPLRNGVKFVDGKMVCATAFGDGLFLYTHVPALLFDVTKQYVDGYLAIKEVEIKRFSGHNRILNALGG